MLSHQQYLFLYLICTSYNICHSVMCSSYEVVLPQIIVSRGLCDRGWCPFIYMYYVYMRPQKSLNGTLAVNSPFQTLVVDFSSNLYTRSTTARFRNAFLVVNHGFPYLMHTCSICPKDDTITVAESHR